MNNTNTQIVNANSTINFSEDDRNTIGKQNNIPKWFEKEFDEELYEIIYAYNTSVDRKGELYGFLSQLKYLQGNHKTKPVYQNLNAFISNFEFVKSKLKADLLFFDGFYAELDLRNRDSSKVSEEDVKKIIKTHIQFSDDVINLLKETKEKILTGIYF